MKLDEYIQLLEAKFTKSYKENHYKEMARFVDAFELTLGDKVKKKIGKWNKDHGTVIYEIDSKKPRKFLYMKIYFSDKWGPLMRLGWLNSPKSHKNLIFPSAHFKHIKDYNKYLDIVTDAVNKHDLEIMSKIS